MLGVSDFQTGDVVQHIFYGRYYTVVKVGREYVHCTTDLENSAPPVRFLPTSLRRVVQ